MPRPQFTIRSLLVALLVVAAFLGGRAYQHRINEPPWVIRAPLRDDVAKDEFVVKIMRLRDGTEWQRMVRGNCLSRRPRHQSSNRPG